jgi:hypothetical protein
MDFESAVGISFAMSIDIKIVRSAPCIYKLANDDAKQRELC